MMDFELIKYSGHQIYLSPVHFPPLFVRTRGLDSLPRPLILKIARSMYFLRWYSH